MRHRTPAFLVACVFSCLLCAAFAQTEPKAPPQREKGILDVVVLDEAGKPLPGVLVSVPGYRSTTGLAGTCRFGLLPGRYAVLISKSGYRGRRVNAGVRPGETTTTHVTLQKLPPRRSPQK
jgi:uncharacterized membrane protein